MERTLTEAIIKEIQKSTHWTVVSGGSADARTPFANGRGSIAKRIRCARHPTTISFPHKPA
jgi:hypothetical protein